MAKLSYFMSLLLVWQPAFSLKAVKSIAPLLFGSGNNGLPAYNQIVDKAHLLPNDAQSEAYTRKELLRKAVNKKGKAAPGEINWDCNSVKKNKGKNSDDNITPEVTQNNFGIFNMIAYSVFGQSETGVCGSLMNLDVVYLVNGVKVSMLVKYVSPSENSSDACASLATIADIKNVMQLMGKDLYGNQANLGCCEIVDDLGWVGRLGFAVGLRINDTTEWPSCIPPEPPKSY